MSIHSAFSRFAFKLQQCAAFARHSRTPGALILDGFKLKRHPFVAVSSEGLQVKLQPGQGESFTFYENLIRHDYIRHGIRLMPGQTVCRGRHRGRGDTANRRAHGTCITIRRRRWPRRRPGADRDRAGAAALSHLGPPWPGDRAPAENGL
jgi:hypothetical protein